MSYKLGKIGTVDVEWMTHFPLKSDLILSLKNQCPGILEISKPLDKALGTHLHVRIESTTTLVFLPVVFLTADSLSVATFKCNHKIPILDPQGDRSDPRKVKKDKLQHQAFVFQSQSQLI